MSARIPRGSEIDRHLRGLGWRRTRRRRRSNRKQPEVWKARKIWETAGRELIVRIVRHGEMYRAEVVRVRHQVPWWQPVRELDMESPLALAMFLNLEGGGDPVRAAYQLTRPHVDDESDWMRAPQSQMPRVVPPLSRWAYSPQSGVDSFAVSVRQIQEQGRIHAAGRLPNELALQVEQVDFAGIERRMLAQMERARAITVDPYDPSLYN